MFTDEHSFTLKSNDKIGRLAKTKWHTTLKPQGAVVHFLNLMNVEPSATRLCSRPWWATRLTSTTFVDTFRPTGDHKWIDFEKCSKRRVIWLTSTTPYWLTDSEVWSQPRDAVQKSGCGRCHSHRNIFLFEEEEECKSQQEMTHIILLCLLMIIISQSSSLWVCHGQRTELHSRTPWWFLKKQCESNNFMLIRAKREVSRLSADF